MKAQIEYANTNDVALLMEHYHRVSPKVLEKKIQAKEVIIARIGNELVGWLTYTLLYDNIPFINSLVVIKEYRSKGFGTQLARFLESEIDKAGFDKIMTSSVANEQGQYFWRKLGYKDVGGVLLADGPLEIFFRKDLQL